MRLQYKWKLLSKMFISELIAACFIQLLILNMVPVEKILLKCSCSLNRTLNKITAGLLI